MKKYKQNLSILQGTENKKLVKSYDTIVAEIIEDQLIVYGWYSRTTQKHINYVAQELDLNIILSPNYEKYEYATK